VLRDELKNMGKLSANEWKTAVIFLVTVFLWVTDRWHVGWWGFQISTATVAILAAALCFLPGIGILTWKETRYPGIS
jgi:di/tricarboxylate transporter